MAKIAKKPKRLKEEDIPVSMKHLMFFKQEIMGAITSLTLEMREGFAKVDARFAEQDKKFAAIDARFAAIDARFSDIDARFASQDAKFAAIDAKFAAIDARFASIETRLEKMDNRIIQVKVIVEEQNDRNKAALDGYITVYEKLVEHDGRFQKIETHIGLH